MPKRIAVGVVTSDKMQKTRRVEIPRLVQHPVYGKYIRKRTVCYVHDEDESSAIGDTVEIVEDRPKSKTKRWDLVRVVRKNSDADVAALRAATEISDADEDRAEEMGHVDRPQIAPRQDAEPTEEVTEEPAAEETTEEPAAEETTEEPAAEETTEEPAAEETTEEPAAEATEDADQGGSDEESKS